MKTLIAALIGGLIVWAIMAQHKPAPVVKAEQRATLHEQMECAAATARYAKDNETAWDDTNGVTGTLHSHYDAQKGQCVGVWDWSGPHLNGAYSWYGEVIDVFDPVEGRDLAGGYWHSATTDASHMDMNSIYAAKSWPRGVSPRVMDEEVKDKGITVGEFYSDMSDQYGVSE